MLRLFSFILIDAVHSRLLLMLGQRNKNGGWNVSLIYIKMMEQPSSLRRIMLPRNKQAHLYNSSSLPTVQILPSVRTHTHELKMISREQSHLNHSHL